MATGLQLVEKYVDNNTALFLLAFLSMYNFVLYFKVGRYENILYFAVIYLGLTYLLKNMNLALLLTYLITTLVFSRNIVEGLGNFQRPTTVTTSADIQQLRTYETDLSNNLGTLSRNLDTFDTNIQNAITNFKGTYNASNTTWTVSEFTTAKNALLNDISANLSTLNQNLTAFKNTLRDGSSNITSYLQGQQNKLNTLFGSYSPFGTTNDVNVFGGYYSEIDGITSSSITCPGTGGGTTTPPSTDVLTCGPRSTGISGGAIVVSPNRTTVTDVNISTTFITFGAGTNLVAGTTYTFTSSVSTDIVVVRIWNGSTWVAFTSGTGGSTASLTNPVVGALFQATSAQVTTNGTRGIQVHIYTNNTCGSASTPLRTISASRSA